MARSKARSRKGKQRKENVIFRPYEDVPQIPSSWPTEIPSSMTYLFRVNAHPDFEVNPFASVGPLKMSEYAFQLEKPVTKDDFCNITVPTPDRHRQLSYPIDSVAGNIRWPQMSRAEPMCVLVGAGIAPDGCDPRLPRRLSLAASSSTASRSLSPDYDHSISAALSRRPSLARTEPESSRCPSPSVASSQDSSLSAVEVPEGVPYPCPLGRQPPVDNAYIRFADSNMPFAHLPLQQQHYYRPSSFYGQHIQEPYPPGQAFQSCDPMQRFPPLGHAQQTRNPTNLRVLMHEEEARSGNSRTPPRVSEGQPGVARQEPGDAGSRSVPSARPDSHPAHPANFPVPHPLHLGPWSVPFSHPLRDPRAAVHDGWRPCSAAGNYPQLPPPAPSQAFRDFMADLGHPGQPPMPLPAPLPPVHAPPLHHFPPHVIGFSVPLRPRAGYRSALKERDWTTHFEALGRKGRKKRSHKKKKSENEDVEIKQPEKYQCPMCDRDFDRRNGLAIHMKWHYKETKDDSYLKGLGIAIPPLNFPHPMYFPPGAAYPPPILNGPMAVAPEMLASSASSGSEGSPELNSLPPSGSDISSARALSANTTLLSVSSLDTLPAPITPLATPPPSPGGSRLSSLVRLSAADVLNASGGPRARSESTRSMWDLFGSDD